MEKNETNYEHNYLTISPKLRVGKLDLEISSTSSWIWKYFFVEEIS